MKGTLILDDCGAATPALGYFPLWFNRENSTFSYCKFVFAFTKTVNSSKPGLLAHRSGCFLELSEVF